MLMVPLEVLHAIRWGHHPARPDRALHSSTLLLQCQLLSDSTPRLSLKPGPKT